MLVFESNAHSFGKQARERKASERRRAKPAVLIHDLSKPLREQPARDD
jgi:hypothetical protein